MLRRQRAGLQEKGQRIALDVLFQHQNLSVQGCGGLDFGQPGTDVSQQGLIGIAGAGELPADPALAGAVFPEKENGSSLAVFQHGFGLILL